MSITVFKNLFFLKMFIFSCYPILKNRTLCTNFDTCSAAWQTGSVVSSPHSRLQWWLIQPCCWCCFMTMDGVQAFKDSRSHSPPQWFSTCLVSIFFPMGQDNWSGCPFTLLIQECLAFLSETSFVGGGHPADERLQWSPSASSVVLLRSWVATILWIRAQTVTKKHHILKGEMQWSAPTGTSYPSPSSLFFFCFAFTGLPSHWEQQENSGDSLGLNLTQAWRMRKVQWHHCQPVCCKNNFPAEEKQQPVQRWPQGKGHSQYVNTARVSVELHAALLPRRSFIFCLMAGNELEQFSPY